LLQFVGSPEFPLPWLFVLACVGKLIAMSAQKIATREVQLDYASSALSTVFRTRADKKGASAAEPTAQMDDGDGLDNVFPSPIPDPDSIGKTEPLSRPCSTLLLLNGFGRAVRDRFGFSGQLRD
jgi:hypothetical protein